MWVPLDSSLNDHHITPYLYGGSLVYWTWTKKNTKGIVCWRHRPGKKFLLHVISSINNSAQLPTICQSQSRGDKKSTHCTKVIGCWCRKKKKTWFVIFLNLCLFFPFLNSVWDFNMFLKSSADTFAAWCPGQMWGYKQLTVACRVNAVIYNSSSGDTL